MAVKRRHDIGTGGLSICPKCGGKVAHRRGIPCQEERRPACGARLLREGSHQHRLFQEKTSKDTKKNA
jgi:hypothetical protein